MIPGVDDLRAAWTGRAAATRVGRADGPHRTALRLLAQGEPVAPARIAAGTAQPVAEVEAWLARMATTGWEVDTQGRLVGAALTLRPTSHRFRVHGNDLYAWCGFDTVFLPVLLDAPAEVESTCPVTGRAIHLSVTADGSIARAEPDTVQVAVVGSAVLESCDTTGPGSAVCSQMPLLADHDAGRRWLADHPGVAVVDLDTATMLARAYVDQGGCCR